MEGLFFWPHVSPPSGEDMEKIEAEMGVKLVVD